MKGITHLRGALAAFIIGIGVIGVAIAVLDTETSELLGQLLGVILLLVGLIGLSALLAWFSRKIIHRKSLK